jgi:Type IV Pilus-assembly protein W
VIVNDESMVRVFDPPAFGGETVRYMSADALIPTCPVVGAVPSNSWCTVSSIRICLLMRSVDNTVDVVATPYIDCDGVQRSQPDRRLRRAMSTTVSIRNRTANPSASAPWHLCIELPALFSVLPLSTAACDFTHWRAPRGRERLLFIVRGE